MFIRYWIAFAPPQKSYRIKRASVHTQERLWRRDFCDGAKLRRADLLSEESHIGLMFILYRIASQK